MIMGAFIPGLRRKYPVHEYISAFLLVLGLILFTLADAQMSPNFSMIGIMMITGALIMDAFLGNLQEAIFTMNPETTQARKLKKTRFFRFSFTGLFCFVSEINSCYVCCADGDAFLLNSCWITVLVRSHGFNRRGFSCVDCVCTSK